MKAAASYLVCRVCHIFAGATYSTLVFTTIPTWSPKSFYEHMPCKLYRFPPQVNADVLPENLVYDDADDSGGEGDSSGWETDDTDTFEGVTRGGDIDSERAFDHLATMLRYRLSCLRTCNTVISCRGKHSLLLYVEWLFVV